MRESHGLLSWFFVQVFAQCSEDGISCHIRSSPSCVLPFFLLGGVLKWVEDMQRLQR